MDDLKRQILTENILNGMSDLVIVPEKKIIIQKTIHHLNSTYVECLQDCPKGWKIPTYKILQWLRNNPKYRDLLNLAKIYEFVQNPDKISKEKGYVARFYADSNGAILSCGRGPSYSSASLGVRYIRRFK